MAVLVTGATGFLGSHVALSLQRGGRQVVATGRNRARLNELGSAGLHTIALDLSQPMTDDAMDHLSSVQTVVHCAGLSSPWGRDADFFTHNVTATRHLIAIAQQVGVKRFVLISTASVYFRFADQSDVSEDQLPDRFVNAYARTKRAAERQVLSHADIGPIVLRPRGIYGAGDTALLPRLLRVARRRPLPRFAQGGATDITHVHDVVRAVHMALAAPLELNAEVFNISGGVGIPLADIIESACARVGVVPRWRRVPFPAALVGARVLETAAKLLPGRPEPPVTAYSLGILRYRQTMDITKAGARLGWHPMVSFEEGLTRTFQKSVQQKGMI
ncbi:NAD-dependent epimerase/dehydratase family protein [Yoonia sp. 2307UL14-13]|uniref:NAD-dependent epimerase/dehydratase family protein n=1 Tax=Yoonia sp. 2307UL14-13 TaxID=3126506 RepID=UPI0030B693CC